MSGLGAPTIAQIDFGLLRVPFRGKQSLAVSCSIQLAQSAGIFSWSSQLVLSSAALGLYRIRSLVPAPLRKSSFKARVPSQNTLFSLTLHMAAMLERLRRRLARPRKQSFGIIARTFIDNFALKVHPYVVKVIPNFRAAHYTYIIFMSFLGAVVVYPISQFRFIDILFLMSGASTQAGLNTVNLNELRLSQQILVYIIATLTTPIFIHGSLLFIRLYWFERHFDNIRESSKLNYRMRRNATLAARTKSMDRTMANTVNNQGIGLLSSQQNGAVALGVNFASHSTSSSSNAKHEIHGNGLSHTICPEPSDEGDVGSGIAPDELPSHSAGIKFGDLPKASKRTVEIDPSDMYKSIAMLQNKRRDSVVDEDVLVIKSPKEIEKSSDTPIYTTKNRLLHFSTPRRKSTSKWKMSKGGKRKALKKIISNTTSAPGKRARSFSNDNESIDSEMPNRSDINDTNYDNESDDSAISSDYSAPEVRSADSADQANVTVEEDAIENSEDELPVAPVPNLEKSDAHLASYGSLKFAQEPTIDRQKRQLRSQNKKGLRRWRTPMISKLNSRSLSDRSFGLQIDEDLDADDEEGGPSDFGDNPLSKVMSTNYLSWTPTIGRNSTFVHLNEEQKEELGGVEYRAVKLLIKIILFYYVGFHIIAFCFYVGFISVAKSYAATMRDFGISPTWWGFFTAQSVFNDLGLTLTPNSMMTFSRSVYILIISCFFIVIGNTGFPILLRFIIWVMFITAKPLSLYKESLGFLLDHPRRCFTLLFPSIPTWWLLFILVVLNGTDLVLFIILDLNRKYLKEIPRSFRILDGLFQAFSTRTAGFSVIDLSMLHAAVQVSYMIMMYISVLPLAISIRRTNVYEEQSLGVYMKPEEQENDDDQTPTNFVGTHLRNQLSFDLWFIFLGLFIICIAEGGKIDGGDTRLTVFSVLFEIISAYGTVGLSLGYPNTDQSLSYKFTTISKLVIIAMMIRGRHRGLPYSLDRAIMLPNANMHRRDEAQEHHAINRAGSLDPYPTRGSRASYTDIPSGDRFQDFRRKLSKKARNYRKNSLFPAPTRLPEEGYEMREINDYAEPET